MAIKTIRADDPSGREPDVSRRDKNCVPCRWLLENIDAGRYTIRRAELFHKSERVASHDRLIRLSTGVMPARLSRVVRNHKRKCPETVVNGGRRRS